MNTLTRALLVLAPAALAAPVLAPPAVTITGGRARTSQSNAYPNSTVGYAFSTLAAPVTVSALGYYDGLGPLTESHQVGIWSLSGTLLASATVTAADSTNADGFAYVTLPTAFTLSANTQYLIGGDTGANNTDPFLDLATTVTANPAITYGDSYFLNGPGFQKPDTDATSFGVTNSYFGPNFQIATATPEPSSLVSLGLGAALLAAFVRRRRA